MKDIALRASELISKGRAARTDVADLGSLRKIVVPADGSSFLVQRTLYIFVADDRTDDDGVSSIRPENVPAFKPGRFRRGALAGSQKA
jgi:hypothetical protein